jgi:two-component system invasion response regulator UvrY
MAEGVQDGGGVRCVLAVVCGSPVVLRGLEQVLAGASGMMVSRSVSSVAGLHGCPSLDVVVVDVSGLSGARVDSAFWDALPGGQGVVMLCRPEDPPDLISALRGGVRGFLTHACQADELVAVVRATRRGCIYASPALAKSLMTQMGGDGNGQSGLSRREAETLRLLAAGLTHIQISRRLGVTEATVSTYVRRIRVKLNAGNKADLTRIAIKLGYAVG